jgi:hypothetical protein
MKEPNWKLVRLLALVLLLNVKRRQTARVRTIIEVLHALVRR